MLDDVSEAFLREDLFPEIGGFMSVRVGWISFTAIVSLVEGEEEGFCSGELGGHVNFLGIDCEVDETTAKLKEWLFRVTVGFVLLDAVDLGGLSSPSVLEFERGDGKTIDEDDHVDLFSLVLGVVFDLARDAELVLLEILLDGSAAAGEWEGIEHGEVGIFYFQSLAKDAEEAKLFHHAVEALDDLELPV